MSSMATNQESRKNIRANFNHSSIFMWRSNYTHKELPLRGSKCPKVSAKGVNSVFTNQESYQNLELTLTLVFFHLVLYLYPLIAPIKKKIIAPNECIGIKDVAINQGLCQT